MNAAPLSAAASGGPGPGQLYDVYPPLPLAEAPPWPLILGAAVLLLLLLVFILLRRRRRGKTPPPRPPADPRAEALAALDSARGLIEEGRPLVYAEQVSDTLRRFLEARFAISSTRRTTREILAALAAAAGTGPAPPRPEEVGALLNACDLAKYARRPAARKQLEEMDRAARRLIDTAGEEG